MSTMLPEPLLQEHRKQAMELSAAARANLTTRVRSTDELRELGLMLGLIEVDSEGSSSRPVPGISMSAMLPSMVLTGARTRPRSEMGCR